MAIATATKYVGVKECKISQLTTDTAGSELVYASSVSVPGIQSLKISKKVTEKQCKGDERVLGVYNKVESIEFSFEHAKLSLDALKIIEGGTLETYGTTPNQKQELIDTSTDTGNYFKLEARCLKGEEVGDVHVTLFKCKASVDIEMKAEDYAIVSIKGTAIPADGKHTVNGNAYNEPLRKLTFNEGVVVCS